MENMVRFILDVVEGNFTLSMDKILASLLTNSFTNLVAEPRYLNYESMVSVIRYMCYIDSKIEKSKFTVIGKVHDF